MNLQEHIKNLQQKEKITPPKNDAILFLGTSFDKPYLQRLKPCVGAATTYIKLDPINTITEVEFYCNSKGISRVVSTSVPLLSKLLQWDKRAAPSLANYSGSYFNKHGIEYVFIQPLKQLVTVSYGQFMATRLISKLTSPASWFTPTVFDWHVSNNPEADYSFIKDCDLIAVDIETFSSPPSIRCIAYTAYWYNTHESISIVLPMDSEYNYVWMKKFNSLPQPKILQNGKYDIAYLTRYNAPLSNYLYDTAHLFHSWYSELPKDLGFLNSFFIREASYWKDLAQTSDMYEYYRYNALDTHGTLNCFLAMVIEAPQWALDNYIKEFPLVFPCHLAEMTGLKRDMEVMKKAREQQQLIIKQAEQKLDTMLAVKGFNVNSPVQMKQLLAVLGCADLESADEKNLKKAALRHPLNNRIISSIIEIRKARKLVSTYLTAGKELEGTDRVLYSLNPHGTDTSRLASREHHFWCGINIQNIPRGPAVKQTLIADPGFIICEVDLEQAESRDTAYIAGDEALIDAVEYSPDFHCKNASAFFGVPFEQLFDITTGKKLNVPLRDLAKRVNHGANYNMGANVLIDTMGQEKIAEAKALLNLPKPWGAKEVAEYLLAQFHKAYPAIRSVYYKGVVEEIVRTKMIKHHTEDGWTRYCFGDPVGNKLDLNAYVAHVPQALNAQTLNKAWLAVFTNIALGNPNFKLCAQVHDSILFQYRIGHEHLIQEVKKLMEIPVTIKGYDGKVRTFTVPAAPSKGGNSWAECK